MATCSWRTSASSRKPTSRLYDVDTLKRQFEDMEPQVPRMLDSGAERASALVLPAYDHVLKASHLFNLMNARGAIAVAERQLHRPHPRPEQDVRRGLGRERGRHFFFFFTP